MLAKFGHRAQVRNEIVDGEHVRYFEHLRRVALILIDEVKITEPVMVKAALLHDSFEDTRDLTPGFLEHCFGTDLVDIVKVLSKTPKEGYLERFIACNDWRPYAIKACDRLDNLRSMKQSTEEFQVKQVKETYHKYFPLLDKMIEIAPPIFRTKYNTSIVDLRDSVISLTLELASNLSISLL